MEFQMDGWKELLKTDPIPQLLEIEDPGLRNRIERDLLGIDHGPEKPLVEDSEYKTLVRRLKPDGSWRDSGRKKNEANWTFITSLRSMLCLLDLGSNFEDEVFDAGARYFIGTQTPDGDYRGAYGDDIPSPNYTGMVADVLFRGGEQYHESAYIALDWLIKIRRHDGGWAIPVLRSKSVKDPFSHCVTGMALRAFPSDPKRKYAEEALKAGKLLAESIFKPDNYPDRRQPEYWGKLSYPFWFTDALSALDVLGKLGFGLSDGRLQRAFDWVLKQQDKNGFWKSDFRKTCLEPDPWLTYSALKVIKFFADKEK
jgi:hypothetical protein